MDRSVVLRLSHQAENEYLAFLNELQKLEVLEYPTNACAQLIKELRKQAEENLRTIRQIRDGLPAKDLSVSFKLYGDCIAIERRKLYEVMTRFLDGINNAQTQKVPWSLIQSIERLAAEIHPGRTPVLCCRNVYNYGVHWYRQVSNELHKYSFIELPGLHRTNILMHTLIGHELFHPCCEEFTDHYKKAIGEKISAEVSQIALNLNPKNGMGKKRIDEITEYLMVMWTRALHELLCDMFCGELFGPAALLAMRAYASFSEWKTKPSRDNRFYPPMQYRLEVVWQHAIDEKALSRLFSQTEGEATEISQAFEAEVKGFGETLGQKEGLAICYEDPLNNIAYIEVNNLVPKAHDYVVSKLPKSISKWTDEKVLKQIPQLVSRLQNGIPPSENPNINFEDGKTQGTYSPEPAELAGILMAGWMYQIYRDKNESEADLLEYDTLSRLLLKGCEDSELIRWNQEAMLDECSN